MEITPLRGASFPNKTAKLQIFRQLTPFYIMKKEAPAFGCLLVEMYIF